MLKFLNDESNSALDPGGGGAGDGEVEHHGEVAAAATLPGPEHRTGEQRRVRRGTTRPQNDRRHSEYRGRFSYDGTISLQKLFFIY